MRPTEGALPRRAARGNAVGRMCVTAGCLGYGLGWLASTSVPALSESGQNLAFGAAAMFFSLSNLVGSTETRKSALVGTCCFIGMLLGYSGSGVAAATSSAGEDDGAQLVALSLYLFLTLVMLFHAIEFAFVVCFHPQDVKFGSFMLTPVPKAGYSIAMIAALSEWWLEGRLLRHLRPAALHVYAVIMLAGFSIGMVGWALRTAALFTAKSNFTHLVATAKRPEHSLVTGGVYRICRHPSYLGWFLWSVCSQLTLLNPVCTCGYAAVSWLFFAGRIPGEEAFLVQFFGQQYLDYARRVPCGIPWISRLR
mmetsp:Transcript_52483/g.97157  ORF Transcript_52483/g.97157 Transcript_52483/m.97157 type:complete len:309 (-) Transcript_52483:72-998(-)